MNLIFINFDSKSKLFLNERKMKNDKDSLTSNDLIFSKFNDWNWFLFVYDILFLHYSSLCSLFCSFIMLMMMRLMMNHFIQIESISFCFRFFFFSFFDFFDFSLFRKTKINKFMLYITYFYEKNKKINPFLNFSIFFWKYKSI